MAAQWVTCTHEHSIKLDDKTRHIAIETKHGCHKYSSANSTSFEEMLDNGFVLSDRWAFKGDGVTVVTMSKELLPEGTSRIVLVFCDDTTQSIIGITPVVYRGKDIVSHVEVFGCQLSGDRTVLGYVIGVLAGSDLQYMDCSTQVVFYDTMLWLPIRSLQGPSGIPPAFSFDPRYQRSRVVILGLQEAPLVQTFCLNSGVFVTSLPVDFYDVDGETSLQLTHTADGCHVIVQVTEYLGYGQEFLYRTYILDSDTLVRRHHTASALASLCHSDCVSQTSPLFSSGFKTMALLSKDSKGSPKVRLHSMPTLSRLKQICRQVLMESGLTKHQVDLMSLSDDIKSFLFLKPLHV